MAIPLAWSLWWLVPGSIVALVVGFMVLIFVVALAEKHPVHAYDATPLAVVPQDLPPYVAAMNVSAARVGYIYGGMFAHAKRGMYQVYSSLWFAPDRRILAVVSGGTILKMPHKKTLLFSPTSDGRYLVTTDELGSGDTSGVQAIEVVLNASFEELVVSHLRRVHALGPEGVPPFEQPSPIEAHRQINIHIAIRTVERGLGRWANEERTMWAYSLKGALRLCTIDLFGGMFRHRSQRHRLDLKRPGSKTDRGFEVVPPAVLPPSAKQERDFLP